MKNSGTLLNRKYRSLLASSLALTASVYLAGIVDSMMVGQLLGTEALSAISLTSPVLFLKEILPSIFVFGGNTLALMYKGRRENELANRVYTLSLLMGLLLSGGLAALGILFAGPTASLLASGGELTSLAAAYLVPLWALSPFTMALNHCSAFARTDGLKSLAAALPIVANLINLTCDYLYMKVFGLGVAGAGWATVTGYAGGLVLVVFYLRSKQRSVHFVNVLAEGFRGLGEIVTTGLPSSMVYVCNFLRLFCTNAIILAATGTLGMKIASVSYSLNSLAFIVAEGAAMTLLPILGALYGEKDSAGQKQAFRYGLFVTAVLCGIVFVLSELFPQQLAGLYNFKDPEGLSIFMVTFRILSINILLLGPVYCLRSFFQATKRGFMANLIVVVDGVLSIVPIMFFLAKIDIYWLWASFPISKGVTIAVTFLAMYLMKKKLNKDNLLLMDTEEGRVLSFSIPNELSEASAASRRVRDFCRSENLSKRSANALAVSTEELCENIATYARTPKSDSIDLCVRIFQEKSTLRVRDNGRVFDPTTYQDDSGKEITGLSLVRSLTNDIEYNRILEFNVTTVTLNNR